MAPTGDANKLRRPPVGVTNEPHLLFARPVANSAPSSQYRFGMSYDGRLAPHHGVDTAPGLGIPIGAAGPGTVFWAGDDLTEVFGTKNDFYGNLVVVKMEAVWNGHTVYTLYGHMSQVAATVGQVVATGDLLGFTGSAGVAYGPHLHFEVRLDDPYSYFGAVRNPELWYKPIPGAGIIAGRLINGAGRFVPGARLFINCKDALRFVDTYWDQGTPPDDVLVENFAVSDIPQGNCNIETTVRGIRYATSVYVPPGEIAFVIIQTQDK
ncbi:MAG: M23 family metallopeptidase [Chloroflexi bacterium]|nr:M23 family metallopeptidase [Chloroflexota bacterium]MBI5293385.1 M23 family metallopeptidase [Chloroflexota bacterium]